MLWACVLLPSLALDGALRNRPPLTQPFALVHGPAQQRTLVAVNHLARAAGLRPGQRLAEAEASCGNLVTAEHVPRRLAADLGLIAAWAYRYSSEVALDPPRAVVLEIGKSLGLFGPWSKLEARLREELAEFGFCHRIALAPTPHAAKVLARAHDGACIADPGALPQALARIPVARAGLPGDAAEALSGMGLHTLGQLFDLPRAALQRRFGGGLLESLDVLSGRVPHTLARYRPPPRFDARIELPAEVGNTQSLMFPLRRLLGDLAAFVAARDGGVQRFVIRFGHLDAAPTDITLGLLAPERDAAALFEVARLRLEQIRLAQPVLELGVHADALPPLAPAGRDLFDARPAHALPWEALRERLRARLGADAVHRIAVDPDPRPERASTRPSGVSRSQAANVPSPSGVRAGACELPGAVRAGLNARASARAGGCLARNEPRNGCPEGAGEGPHVRHGADVLVSASTRRAGPSSGAARKSNGGVPPLLPEGEGQRRSRIEAARARARVDESLAGGQVRLPSRPTWLLARPILLRGLPPRILAGPERLETGWWDGGDIRRDYYVVELSTGQRAWVFSPPGEREPFMLHGWFA
jgi:protein ImuB